MLLTTIEKIKAFLKMPDDSDHTGDDSLFRDLIMAVSKQIELHLNRGMEQKEYTEVLDSSLNMKSVNLKNYPVVETIPAVGEGEDQYPIKIWYDTDRVFGESALLKSEDYFIEYNDGIVHLDNFFSIERKQTMKAQYTGGLAKTSDRLVINATLGEAAVFELRELLTGSISGATGKFISFTEGETPGTGQMVISVINGLFEAGETISGEGEDPSTAVIDEIITQPLIYLYPDIALAVAIQIAFMYQRKDELGLRSISVQGAAISTYQTLELLPEVRSILQPYRNPNL